MYHQSSSHLVFSSSSFSFITLILLGIVLRIALSLHPHSGFGVEPLHGDFEAQRHWVEITMNLPPSSSSSSSFASLDWYRNTTTGNDLLWWGLDYPPWSAFHALVIGKVTRFVIAAADPSSTVTNTSFGLLTSRGAEDQTTIIIMRMASLITDIIFYLIPIWIFYKDFAVTTTLASSGGIFQSHNFHDQDWTALFFLVAPIPQLFIDHGHFQFNSVPAGLILTCIALMTRRQDRRKKLVTTSTSSNGGSSSSSSSSVKLESIGGFSSLLKVALVDGFCAFLATTAVMFKQMSLYFAPAVAVVLLFRTLCLANGGEHLGMKVTSQQQQQQQKNTNNSRRVPPPSPMTINYDDDGNSIMSAIKKRPSEILFRMTITLIFGVFGFVLPFLIPGYPLVVSDVLTRIFPFARGLYEDKVANFWCAVSPFFKLPNYVPSREWVVRTCALTTIASFLPAARNFFVRSMIERRLNRQRISVLFTVCALSFFLFSFQVHEKSILMAVCSTIGIWVSQDARQAHRSATTRLVCCHFMFVAMVSLQPLAVKDKLDGSAWCTLALLGCLVASVDAARSFGYCEMLLSSRPNLFDDDEETRQLIEKSKQQQQQDKHQQQLLPLVLMNIRADSDNIKIAKRKMFLYFISLASLAFVSILAPLFIEPSEKLPDIIPVMNSMVCCAHFLWYWWHWTNHLLVQEF